MGVCLAYTPTRPALHRLSAASWLIASICDGRSLADLAVEYRAALGDEAGSEAALRRGIEQLLAIGVLRRLPPGPGVPPVSKDNFSKGGYP
jgi:hypothetical protein